MRHTSWMHQSGLASLKKSALALIENLYIRPGELARMQKPTERPKGI
ncbi:hypothetical protein ACIG56_17545 [Nocardia fusca]